MGRNVFVSYKYGDLEVKQFESYHRTTVRDYVNVISRILDSTDELHYRGEKTARTSRDSITNDRKKIG